MNKNYIILPIIHPSAPEISRGQMRKRKYIKCIIFAAFSSISIVKPAPSRNLF